MSLSEIIMGVNSQAVDVPLNHLMWLADYKTYGENSYVFQNKDILHELYKSPVAANDLKICNEAFEYIGNNCENIIGLWLANVYSLKSVSGLRDCSSIADIISTQSAFDAVVASVFKDTFFDFNKTALSFATTAGLKAASGNNDVMTLLESSDIFKQTVLTNPDIQTLDADIAYGTSASISVNNAFIISMTQGVAIYMYSDPSTFTYVKESFGGAASYILHGKTTRDTVIASFEDKSNIRGASTTVVDKFVKTASVVQPSGSVSSSVINSSSGKNTIKYIQLDNIV